MTRSQSSDQIEADHGRGRHRKRSWIAAPLLAGLVLGLAACTGSGDTASPPATSGTGGSSSVSETPSPDPTAQAEARVLAAYRGFLDAAVTLYARPDKASPRILDRYAFEKAAGGVRDTQLRYKLQGIAQHGRPVSRGLRVTAVNLDAKPPTAVLADCLDTTTWVPVDVRTGKSVAVAGTLGRRPVSARARVFEGRWVIVEFTADRSRSC